MKKLYKASILCLGAMTILSACGKDNGSTPKENEQVKLWVPFSGPDGVQMEKIVKEYNQSKGKDVINFQIVPQSEYYKTLDLNLATEKNGPDMMVVHGDMMLGYVNKGLLKELDGFLKENNIVKESYNENAWDNANKKEKQYGVPFDTHPLLFYYNKDMFTKAGLDPEKYPKTKQEFLQYAQVLTNVENKEYGFVVPTLWPQQFIFPTIVYQNGGEFLKDGKPNFDTPEILKSLEFLKDLIYTYKVSPTNVQQDGEVTLFLQGKNAMHFNGPWMEQQWKDAGLNYGVAEVPMLGDEKQAVYANSHNFTVPSYVKSEDKMSIIADFLKYLEDNSLPWANSGQAPVAKKMQDTLKGMPQQSVILSELDYVQYSPEVENWGSISSSLWEEVNMSLLNQKDSKKALEDATKKAIQFTN
ncbi:ABC transporter substrate-binding protein [Cetobacterium somerae]|uniref:ABC transporter substrate-binding protein n=1 Tax=Cetobacterium sp. NK01 TaxID=2993530 RepID=UPI002116598A|nr:ABC transporter substrate-binding protein [Cetobacterium sp. NK01]MCQ8211033.1 ABC transporter substrate-binding protein [Cetobacterium sp. NK01]